MVSTTTRSKQETAMPLAVMRQFVLAIVTSCFAGAAFAADEEKAKSEDKAPRDVKVEDLVLKIPADWKQQPPANRLRLAQFDIPKAEGDEQPTEMVVSFFGGAGGGVDANIERWIGQFTNAGRKANVTKGTSKLGPYYLVNISGTYKMPIGPPIQGRTQEMPDSRMLGIILEREGQGNYFLKMAGPDKTVSAQEEALRASIGGDKKTEKPHEVK
jgi:gluconolactonase